MSCFKKRPCRYSIACIYIIDICLGLFLCGIPQKYLITANLHTSVLRSTEMGSPLQSCKHTCIDVCVLRYSQCHSQYEHPGCQHMDTQWI